MSAKLLLHEKIIQEDGSIVETKIWKVPESERYPFGVKYSLYLVADNQVLVGYDNHYPKGPHKHYGHTEVFYFFKDVETLVNDFHDDLNRIKRK